MASEAAREQPTRRAGAARASRAADLPRSTRLPIRSCAARSTTSSPSIIELYGEGLTRIVRELAEQGDEALLLRLAGDGVDRQPDADPRPLPGAARGARGGGARERAPVHGVARRRRAAAAARATASRTSELVGHCHGCPASAATLELAIKEALDEAAPDLLGLEVEGVAEAKPDTQAARDGVHAARRRPPERRAGCRSSRPGAIEPGTFRALALEGVDLVVANVDGNVLAYRDHCAACAASLRRCDARGPVPRRARRAGARSTSPRAGRAAAGLGQLDPVPLLRRERACVRGGARLMTGGSAPAVRRLRQLAQARPPRAGLRGRAAPPGDDHCDLCGVAIDPEHRHLLHLVDRRITLLLRAVLRAARGRCRAAAVRERASSCSTTSRSTTTSGRSSRSRSGSRSSSLRERGQGVVALYPSPAGATESELHLDAWDELVAANPVLGELEPEVEALIVEPHERAAALRRSCRSTAATSSSA